MKADPYVMSLVEHFTLFAGPGVDNAEDHEGVWSVHGAEREAVRMKTLSPSSLTPLPVDRGGNRPPGGGGRGGAAAPVPRPTLTGKRSPNVRTPRGGPNPEKPEPEKGSPRKR